MKTPDAPILLLPTLSPMAVELTGAEPGFGFVEEMQEVVDAVAFYFRNDLQRDRVTLGEFLEVLEAALSQLFGDKPRPRIARFRPRVVEFDLRRFAAAAGKGFELSFFRLLRRELRQHLAQCQPRLVRCVGLKSCVKQLHGRRRWTGQCQRFQEQLVEFLRHTLHEQKAGACTLLVC